jgi:hypothetical protein
LGDSALGTSSFLGSSFWASSWTGSLAGSWTGLGSLTAGVSDLLSAGDSDLFSTGASSCLTSSCFTFYFGSSTGFAGSYLGELGSSALTSGFYSFSTFSGCSLAS